MDRPDITVKVGAAFDRSFDVVLADAQKKWERAFGAGGKSRGMGANEQQALAIASKIYEQQSALNRKIYSEQIKKEIELARIRSKLSSDHSRERQREAKNQDSHIRAYYRNIVVEHQRAEAAKRAEERKTAAERSKQDRAERTAAARQAREIDRFATRTSHRATRFFFPPPEGALGYAKRTALDLARGAGVDFSLGGGVARARERETAGMGLAQQERIAQGGVSRGGSAWSAQTMQIGTELKTDPAQVTAMIRAFTGKTGDFAAMTMHAKELASMTLASGANMDEMGSAAGYVYNQLKGMPDAAERTLAVMRGIVGQTAVGAVEMEEYAKQMGRIAANAKMFQGDVSKNILELSALTQLSIAEGGATSGADAARSIAAFANTTSKGQRINAFKKHGVDLFNESGTQKRPILDIIKDSLIASKGNIPAMTQMWADTLGQKPIRGLTNAFNEAGGGERGWQAALAKIEPFMKAQLDKETERKNLADYGSTVGARAQAFQNNLDKITESLANRLLPVMERAAPVFTSLMEKLSAVVSWAAENPGKAIVSAITLSIGRAGLESVGRLFLDRLMSGVAANAMGQGLAGAAGGLGATGVAGASTGMAAVAGGGVAGTLGVIAALAAVGIGAYTLTDSLLELSDKLDEEKAKKQATDMNQLYFETAGKINSAQDPLERQRIYEASVKKIAAEETQRTGSNASTNWSAAAQNTLRSLRDTLEKTATPRSDKERAMLEMGYKDAAKTATSDDMMRAFVGALTGRSIDVRVRNFDDMNFTPANGESPKDPARWFS